MRRYNKWVLVIGAHDYMNLEASSAIQWRSDKSNEDYEYEKSKDECTFVPNLIRISNGNDASDHVSVRALRDKKSSFSQ